MPQGSIKALELLEKLANQSYSEVIMHNLGFMYQTGQGVSQNCHKEIEWYKKAAVQGNINSQNNLGFMYQNGEGVAKNQSEAIKWYQKQMKVKNLKFNKVFGFRNDASGKIYK